MPSSARADDSPRVELPLGPYVRPGRPLDVRVLGGADRVRAPGGPWALPQGERGDEFLLQPTQETALRLELTIEKDGRRVEATPSAGVLPESTPVRGVAAGRAADAAGKAGPGIVVEIPTQGLPTVRDAWRLLDAFDGPPVPKLARDVFGSAEGDDVSRQTLALPALQGPLPEAFVATAEAARRAPLLSSEVGAALTVLAGAEALLVLVLALRRESAARRAAWLCAPAIVALAWLAAGERLPGPLRATAVDVDGPSRTVFVRVDALRAGVAEFSLPEEAGNAWVVRFAADDRTIEEVSAGRQVRLALEAGESRVFCYGLPRRRADDVEGVEAAAPASLQALLTALRLRADGAARLSFPVSDLPSARGASVAAALSVRAQGPTPVK